MRYSFIRKQPKEVAIRERARKLKLALDEARFGRTIPLDSIDGMMPISEEDDTVPIRVPLK